MSDQIMLGIIGGRWDKYKRRWEQSSRYKSLEARFKHGNKWEDLEKYKNKPAERHNEIDSLYESIKNNGYIPASELMENPERNEITNKHPKAFEIRDKKYLEIRDKKYPDECRIGIGRNGELIRLGGGYHRISIAKILDLDTVPVLLLVRHKKWQELRDEIYNNGLPEGREDLRDHPDIQDVLN